MKMIFKRKSINCQSLAFGKNIRSKTAKNFNLIHIALEDSNAKKPIIKDNILITARKKESIL